MLFIGPPTCKAYPIAILLHDRCEIYAPPPPIPPLLCRTQYNIGDDNIVFRPNGHPRPVSPPAKCCMHTATIRLFTLPLKKIH